MVMVPMDEPALSTTTMMEKKLIKVADTVHYQPQFASPSLIKKILENKFEAKHDPLWHTFGFTRIEDYVYWSWRACGVACLMMAIRSLSLDKNMPSMSELILEGLKVNAYLIKESNGTKSEIGWTYAGLIQLGKEYGLNGCIERNLEIHEIVHHLKQKHFVIASVDPFAIRGESLKKMDGGHLIFIYGLQYTGDTVSGLLFHNPSGKGTRQQQNVVIKTEKYISVSAKRGLALWSHE